MNSENNLRTGDWALLCQALDEALRTMTGLELDWVTSPSAEVTRTTYAGMMVLAAERPSLLLIRASQSTARMIFSYMTGEEPDSLGDKELADGLCELVNMVAGDVKSKRTGTEAAFELTPPVSVQGDGLFFRGKTGTRVEQVAAADAELSLSMSLFVL